MLLARRARNLIYSSGARVSCASEERVNEPVRLASADAVFEIPPQPNRSLPPKYVKLVPRHLSVRGARTVRVWRMGPWPRRGTAGCDNVRVKVARLRGLRAAVLALRGGGAGARSTWEGAEGV